MSDTAVTFNKNKPQLVKPTVEKILRLLGRDPETGTLEGADLSGWGIYEARFPEGTSFKGCNLTGTSLIECDLPCDFTDAKTDGIVLDCSTVSEAIGLGLNTAASKGLLNPYENLSDPDFKLGIPFSPAILADRDKSRRCACKIT